MRPLILAVTVSTTLGACTSPTAVDVTTWYELDEVDGRPLPVSGGFEATVGGGLRFAPDGECVRLTIYRTVDPSGGPDPVERTGELGCTWNQDGAQLTLVWDDSDPTVPKGAESVGTVDGDLITLFLRVEPCVESPCPDLGSERYRRVPGV
jgi:hypothetical protein